MLNVYSKKASWYMEDKVEKSFEDAPSGTSLAAQWLQIWTFTGVGVGSISGWCNEANKQVDYKMFTCSKKSHAPPKILWRHYEYLSYYLIKNACLVWQVFSVFNFLHKLCFMYVNLVWN